jgi:hypothetical protein
VILAVASDHRCDRFGYQIATAPPLPRCPMCGGIHDWRLTAPPRRLRVHEAPV